MADYVVLLKVTPDVRMLKESDFKDGVPNLANANYQASPFDLYALEAALRYKETHGGEVVTLTLGEPAKAEQSIRNALGRGADRALLVHDDALKGQYGVGDSGLVAKVLAAAITKRVPEYGLVFAGAQSEDSYAGAVAPMVAEYLGIPQLTFVDKLDFGADVTVERSREGGYEKVTRPAGKLLVTVTNSLSEPRFASMKGIMMAKKKPLDKLTLADLGVTAAPRVTVSYAKPAARQDACQLVGEGLTMESLAERIKKVTG